jgi:DNA-binding response OmpR family regulator
LQDRRGRHKIAARQPINAARKTLVTAARILVVDDEPGIRDMLGEYLSSQGFAVTDAGDAPTCRQLLKAQSFDVVLLDITLPGEDGLSLARHIRETYGCGIVMVTAARSTVDRVVGLEIGADDYIAKPFDPRELLARVRSVLRRLRTPAGTVAGDGGGTGSRPSEVRVGRCWFDADGRRLTADAGEVIPLTAMEYDLLKALTDRPNRVLSRDQLLDLAHHRDAEPFDRSIDIRIARLRRKVEVDPAKPAAIKTVRGLGYMFVPTPRPGG